MQTEKDSYVVMVSGSFHASITATSVPCVFNNVPLVCPFPVRKLTVTVANVTGRNNNLGAAVYYGLRTGPSVFVVSDRFRQPLVMCNANSQNSYEWVFDTPTMFTTLHNLSIYSTISGWSAALVNTSGGRQYAPLVPYSVTYTNSSDKYFLDVGIMFEFHA